MQKVSNIIVKRTETFPSPNLYKARAHTMAHNFLKKKRLKREKTSLIYQFKGRLGNVTQIDVRAWLGDKIMHF